MSARSVRIGKIVGFHGVRGEVKVRPTSDDAPWAETVETICLKKPGESTEQPMRVISRRRHGPHVLLTFEGAESRTLAEPLLGAFLYVDSADLPAPEADEYWADDLIGLMVTDAETGRNRGTVKDLLSSSGSDFLEIQLEHSKETVVVPFINRFFPEVDLEAGTITIDLLS